MNDLQHKIADWVLEAVRGWWPISHDWALVLLTAVLAFFTWRLVVEARKSSAQQTADNLELLELTRESSEAAVRSAQVAEAALHAADRPWLYATVSGGFFRDENTLRRFTPNDPAIRPITFNIIVQLQNAGKTPAAIEQLHFEFPTIGARGPILVCLPVVPGEGINCQFSDTFELTASNRHEFMMNLPAFVGRVRYRTPLNLLKEMSFSFVLTSSMADDWRRCGDRSVNYEIDVAEAST